MTNFEIGVSVLTAILLLLGVIPLRASWRRNGIWAAIDLALLVAPATVFVATIVVRARSSSDQVAWGLLGYPWFILMVSLASVYIAVYTPVIARPPQTAVSAALLLLECSIAIFWAASI